MSEAPLSEHEKALRLIRQTDGLRPAQSDVDRYDPSVSAPPDDPSEPRRHPVRDRDG